MKKVLSVILAIVLIAAPLTVAASASSITYPNEVFYDTASGMGASPADEGMGATSSKTIFTLVNLLEKVRILFNQIFEAIIEFLAPTPINVTPQPAIEPTDYGKFYYTSNITLNEENIFAGYYLSKADMKIYLQDCSSGAIRFEYILPPNWAGKDIFIEYVSPVITIVNCNDSRVYLNTSAPLDYSDPFFLATMMVVQYNLGDWNGEEFFSYGAVITLEKVTPFEGRDTVIRIVEGDNVYGFLLIKDETTGTYHLP